VHFVSLPVFSSQVKNIIFKVVFFLLFALSPLRQSPLLAAKLLYCHSLVPPGNRLGQ